ncbi:MAG: glycosyltransferase [Clostridia bacterium]|nr:glycosyltransferase [Clostridia bacterium]
MKILHIITDTNIGGAGKLLVAVLKNIDRERFDVVVAVPRGSALIPLIEETGTRVVPTEYGRDKSFEQAAVRELCRVIKAEKPDVVHTHASLSGRIAAKKCGVRLRFMTRHCVFDEWQKYSRFPRKQIFGALSNYLTTNYVATAEAAKRQLIDMGCDEKKITVIQNGSEKLREITPEEKNGLRAALGIPSDAFVVGIAARLEIYKGHKYLLDALKKLSVNNIYILIVGDGGEMANLKAYAEDLGISDKVIFAGFQSDMALYYGIMDVGANCSFGTETTPLAITEAMALGVPSIVSDYGGNPDTVTNDVDGIVIPQKNADALAEAIRVLYCDREMLKRLSDSARATYAKKYSAEIMTEKLEKLYLSAAESVKERDKK